MQSRVAEIDLSLLIDSNERWRSWISDYRAYKKAGLVIVRKKILLIIRFCSLYITVNQSIVSVYIIINVYTDN